MPNCCVPGCNTGYKSVKNDFVEAHLFTPPLGSISLWQKAIPRKFKLTRKHRVCHKHFPEHFIISCYEHTINGEKIQLPRTRWMLTENAVPQIFPHSPKYISKLTTEETSCYSSDTDVMNKFDCLIKEESIDEPLCEVAIEEQKGNDTAYVDKFHCVIKEENTDELYGLTPVKPEESLILDNDTAVFIKKEKEDENDSSSNVIIKEEEEVNTYYGASEDLSNKVSTSQTTSQLYRSQFRGIGQGFEFCGEAREIVVNVRDHFEHEKGFGGPLCSINKTVDRTAAATKVSKATISKIANEKNVLHVECGPESSPQLRKRSRLSNVITLDSFQEEAIRKIIYGYFERKEYPTFRKLLQSMEDANLFSGSITALSMVLKKLGFKYTSVSGRKLLIEKHNIVLWRCRFLRAMIKPQINLENVVWLGETCVNVGHTIKKNCKDDPRSSSFSGKSGKGERLILRHAGTSKGFILGAKDVIVSKKTGDFQEEMSSLKFKEWFLSKLLFNLKTPSVIVMDSAPYHSKVTDRVPTAYSTKTEILSWLTLHSITADEDARKVELLDLVNQNKPQFPSYEIDVLAAQFGHEVLRLPPHHSYFNPIELIWANIKEYVAKNNTQFTLVEIERLINEGIERITEEDWMQSVQHVEKSLHDAWRTDVIVEEALEEIVIKLSSGSISSASDEELEEDDDLQLE